MYDLSYHPPPPLSPGTNRQEVSILPWVLMGARAPCACNSHQVGLSPLPSSAAHPDHCVPIMTGKAQCVLQLVRWRAPPLSCCGVHKSQRILLLTLPMVTFSLHVKHKNCVILWWPKPWSDNPLLHRTPVGKHSSQLRSKMDCTSQRGTGGINLKGHFRNSESVLEVSPKSLHKNRDYGGPRNPYNLKFWRVRHKLLLVVRAPRWYSLPQTFGLPECHDSMFSTVPTGEGATHTNLSSFCTEICKGILCSC